MRFGEQHGSGHALRLELMERIADHREPRVARRRRGRACASASARVNSGVCAGHSYHSPRRWMPSISRPLAHPGSLSNGRSMHASRASRRARMPAPKKSPAASCRKKGARLRTIMASATRALVCIVNIRLLHNAPSSAIISRSTCSERSLAPRRRRILARTSSPRSRRLRPLAKPDIRLRHDRRRSDYPACERDPRARDGRRAKRPSAAIPACRWAWPRSPSRCGTATCATTPRIRTGPNRDRFVLSNGHGSMLLYALLHLTGYDLPIEELQAASASCIRRRRAIRKSASRPASRRRPARSARASPTRSAWRSPNACSPPNSTGPATRSSTTAPTCFVGDGCLMEGISHEACSLAGTLRPRQADRVLRRQRHLDRRRDARAGSPTTRRSASRPTAGT